jgi:metallo-beta-lactamase family protein
MRHGGKPLAPLYTRQDVHDALRRVRSLAYGQEQQLFTGVHLRLYDAGHILGSAAIELASMEDGRTRRMVFSGDIGPKGTPILCDPAPIQSADLVLMESTYGNRLHRSRADTVAELGSILLGAHASRGNVVIPAFAVGRTQELLYWFAQHYDEWNLSSFRIFLDSPMATKVVQVYERHEGLFDTEARAFWKSRPHPLKLPNLWFTDSVGESQAINEHEGGAIIIAGSGMCNGGRIRHHLKKNLGRRNAHIVFVGYQAEGTLGRLLVDGVPRVKLFGEWIDVHARRHTIGGLSAHADQAGLMDWYGQIGSRPPVYLVHGEDTAREPLAECLRVRYGTNVGLARPGMVVKV